MLSKIYTVGLSGIEGFMVQFQTDISNGMPGIDIIGLPGMTVKEAKERAKTSIKNSGFAFPQKRITINMAPAALHKEGGHYDLPLTVSILNASEQLPVAAAKDFPYHCAQRQHIWSVDKAALVPTELKPV